MNIEGKIFKYLNVLKKLDERKSGHLLYLCKCVCGKEIKVTKTNLTSGNTGSCGCMKCFKHGHVKGRLQSLTYKKYHDMKNRCYNKNVRSYKNYGAKGITVCSEWLGENGFINFLNDMGDCPNNYSLERIDNYKGYSKENCIWIPKNLQQSNKRNSIKVTFNGVTKTESEWSKFLKIPKSTLRKRRLNNWPLDLYLSKPDQSKNTKGK